MLVHRRLVKTDLSTSAYSSGSLPSRFLHAQPRLASGWLSMPAVFRNVFCNIVEIEREGEGRSVSKIRRQSQALPDVILAFEHETSRGVELRGTPCPDR
jgi:hypothetical protein